MREIKSDRLLGYAFKPRLLPTLAALVVLALTLSLGRWQLNRAQEKLSLQRQYDQMAALPALTLSGHENDAEPLQYRRLVAKGIFAPDKQILLDNRPHANATGYHVMTPLKLVNSNQHVLVNRGWVPRGEDYRAPPRVPVSAGDVRIEGFGAIPSARFLELSTTTVEGPVWQNLVLSRYRAAFGIDVLPIVILQQNDTGDRLTRVQEKPDTGVATHHGYAFQWFALAAAVLILYVILNTEHVERA